MLIIKNLHCAKTKPQAREGRGGGGSFLLNVFQLRPEGFAETELYTILYTLYMYTISFSNLILSHMHFFTAKI